MNILLVDNHTLFRAGIKEILSEHSTDHLIDECVGIECMKKQIELVAYDLVLLEVGSPSCDGIDYIQDLKQSYPGVKIAALSAEIDPIVMHRSIDYGAVGFITKSSTRAQLLEAVELIFAGKMYLPVEYTAPRTNVINTGLKQRTGTSILTCLSKRQREVLILLLHGKPNKTISNLMNISQNTVKAHMSAIFRTLGANNRTEAVYYAARAGIPFDLPAPYSGSSHLFDTSQATKRERYTVGT